MSFCCLRALKKSCIHFATPEGQLIPFESYNLFYRPGKQHLLQSIRQRLARQAAGRVVPLPIALHELE